MKERPPGDLGVQQVGHAERKDQRERHADQHIEQRVEHDRPEQRIVEQQLVVVRQADKLRRADQIIAGQADIEGEDQRVDG